MPTQSPAPAVPAPVTPAPAPTTTPAPTPPAPKSDLTAEQQAHENEVRAAEKRLADAKAAQAAAATPKVTSFVGIPNGPFVIEGENLGNVRRENGVKIDGLSVTLTAVRPHSLKGVTPRDVKPGKHVTVEVTGAAKFTDGFVG